LANIVWIGSLLSVAALLSDSGKTTDPATSAKLARRTYLHLSVPAFLVSLICGLVVLTTSASLYFHAPWMHAKLTLAVVVIALHHVLGARARRAAGGQAAAALGARKLALAIFACSACVVWLAVTRWLP
jgi:putative membrane protein